MKKYLALLLFVFITTLTFGQSNNYQDVIYLKNGSIIRGLIIEKVPGESIKIETADRNVFVFQMDEVKKLSQEPYQTKSGSSFNRVGLQSGYKGIVELGYQIGLDEYGMDRLKMNFINGYQINPFFSLGIGTGMRYYIDAKAALIPIFADFRANFVAQNISPYLAVGVGYSFDASIKFEGVGFLLSPSVGVSFRVSDESILNVGIGYEMQKMKFVRYYHDFSSGNSFGSELIENSGVLSFSVGLSFNGQGKSAHKKKVE